MVFWGFDTFHIIFAEQLCKVSANIIQTTYLQTFYFVQKLFFRTIVQGFGKYNSNYIFTNFFFGTTYLHAFFVGEV